MVYSSDAAPKVCTLRTFVERVNVLWAEVSSQIERKQKRRSTFAAVAVEIVTTPLLQSTPGHHDLLSCTPPPQVPPLECYIEDVKDLEQSDLKVKDTVALLCSRKHDGTKLRALVRKEVLRNGGWSSGNAERLKYHSIKIASYQVRWQSEKSPNDGHGSEGTIIEVQSCVLIGPADPAGITKDSPRIKSQVQALSVSKKDIGSVDVSPACLRVRESISALLAPMCSATPEVSSQESLSQEEAEDEVNNGLAIGLDDSCSMERRAIDVTPVPSQQPRTLIVKPANGSGRGRGRKTPAPIACREVQRNKRVREAMPGYDCELCREWHRNIAECFPNVASDVVRVGQCQCNPKRPSGMVSRHRFAAAPTATPTGFWDIRFPPTQQPNSSRNK
eukprot:Protomagalhaensia_wolfi_Nauph_80__5951@NODE_794_length_1991_cov_15_532787_g598_i0_p1_GENE_NODE_794_length_1991_cov_15_532787_g598_i0NODE_794_length_1991_cov_15_532787_g598_i0_p1_ORF_typecomplete_len389_score20_13SAE2/PF08573_10/1SAE2/PF08573_10/3_3e05DUF4559/PF15112_6/0_27_NODE_794_length_1991_cov_15_532787_g598_i0341200